MPNQLQNEAATHKRKRGKKNQGHRKRASIGDLLQIKINDLELRDVLGKGIHGKVYRGKYNGNQVAIKDFKVLETFDREIKNLRRLRHRHVITLIGCCETFDLMRRRFLVMELANCNLTQVVYENEKFSSQYVNLKSALKWAREICNGFDFIHTQDVIHYDLKPTNILLSKDWEVKLCDFSTSRRPVSGLGEDAGTPSYTAPEILGSDKKDLTKKVDVYSFGMVLWEIVHRTEVYKEEDFSVIQVLNRVKDNYRPKLSQFVPEALGVLIKDCWDAEPSNRPEFSDILTELGKIQNVVEG